MNLDPETEQRIAEQASTDSGFAIVHLGHTFGSRTVVSEAPSDGHNKRWSVQCTCGHVAIMTTQSILKGYRCRACWVYPVKHGHNRMLTRTRTYRIWSSVIQRTTNPKAYRYADYGGRGITIEDERWFKFEHFLDDMGECPDDLTLERLKNSIGYRKDNCEWKSRRDQSRNTRQNRIVEYQGQRMCLMEAIQLAGVKYTTTQGRMRRWKCTFEESLIHPLINMKLSRRHEDGRQKLTEHQAGIIQMLPEQYTNAQIAKVLGVNKDTIRDIRLFKSWKQVEPPAMHVYLSEFLNMVLI